MGLLQLLNNHLQGNAGNERERLERKIPVTKRSRSRVSTKERSYLVLQFPAFPALLTNAPPAIDGQDCAGGELSCIGSEIQDRGGDFFAGAESANGMLCQ